jgi:hypothetical protein
MKIRGERECQACGQRWSYYETGSVECPDCGSLRSVGVDDRTAHTDGSVTLDLSRHRSRFGEASGTLPAEGVDELKSDLREYLRKRGFIQGGALGPLDTTFLAARELLEAVDCYDRLRDPTDADREYLLDLLRTADDGVRPPAGRVPGRLREARGLASAYAVDEYRTDLLAFLDELAGDTGGDAGQEPRTVSVSTADADPDTDLETRIEVARSVLDRIRDRVNRVDALNGDVPVAEADALVDAANALGEYVRSGDEGALDRSRDRLADQEP